MKVLLVFLVLACSAKLSEGLLIDVSISYVITKLCATITGYLCYDCNSTIDVNCFDFSPTFSYYKAVECDPNETGAENCIAVHISGEIKRLGDLPSSIL